MTDPTRPVRDQTADDDETALRKDLWRELFAARDERDALRATVDRVRALADYWLTLRQADDLLLPGPAAAELRACADDLRRALDGATQAAPRPHLCDGCNVRPGWEHRCHGNDGAWRGDPVCQCPDCAPAAQGVPLTEDRSIHAIDGQAGDHVCGEPSGAGTDWRDPALTITCPECRVACWLCRHPAATGGNCTACGCLAHYPPHRLAPLGTAPVTEDPR